MFLKHSNFACEHRLILLLLILTQIIFIILFINYQFEVGGLVSFSRWHLKHNRNVVFSPIASKSPTKKPPLSWTILYCLLLVRMLLILLRLTPVLLIKSFNNNHKQLLKIITLKTLYLQIFICVFLVSVSSIWELSVTVVAQSFCSSGRLTKNRDWGLVSFMLYCWLPQSSTWVLKEKF